MDRFTYNRMREKLKHLAFPPWHRLTRTDRHRAKRMTQDQMVAGRARVLLLGSNDKLQPVKAQNILVASNHCRDLWNTGKQFAGTQSSG